MTATLLLIRHAAHTDFGERFTGRADGAPLSAAGRDQARVLADRLAREPIVAVYASPRTRTQETARAVAEPHGLAVRTADEIDEIDFGDWTGAPLNSLDGDPDFVRWNEQRGSARVPNGEDMTEVADRAERFAYGTAAAHAGETVAMVSHADVIRGLAARVLGLPLDNLLRFDVDPASVSRVAVGDWGAKLLSLNERVAA